MERILGTGGNEKDFEGRISGIEDRERTNIIFIHLN